MVAPYGPRAQVFDTLLYLQQSSDAGGPWSEADYGPYVQLSIAPDDLMLGR